MRLRASHRSSVIPLPVLFDLSALIEWFHERPELMSRLKDATEVAKTIRQYKVPAYQVEHGDVNMLQDIFDRLNNYGKRLSKAEIFTALNAGAEDDVAHRLTIPLIAENISAERAFGVLRNTMSSKDCSPVEILMSCVTSATSSRARPGLSFQERIVIPPTKKRRWRCSALWSSCRSTPTSHTSVCFRIGTCSSCSRDSSRISPIPVRRTFGCSDAGSGGPWRWDRKDFAAAPSGAIRALSGAIAPGDLSGSLRRLLDLVVSESFQVPNLTRFRANEARTKIVLCAWWYAEPRSPETGLPFDQSALAECLTDSWTASGAIRSVLARRDVPDKLRQHAANRVLLPPLRSVDSEIAPLLVRPPDNLDQEQWSAVLDSHAISPQAAERLSDGLSEEFIEARHELLSVRLKAFMDQMCEWSFEDTPPLAELELDEDDDGVTE